MKYCLKMYQAKSEYADEWDYVCEKVFDYEDVAKAKRELFLLYLSSNSRLRELKITEIDRLFDDKGELTQISIEYGSELFQLSFYSIFFKFRVCKIFDEEDTFINLLTHENAAVRKFVKESQPFVDKDTGI